MPALAAGEEDEGEKNIYTYLHVCEEFTTDSSPPPPPPPPSPSPSSSSIFLPILFPQVANMFFTGLLGGAMYVNVFANLVDDPTIANKDRELGINIVALFVNAVS